MVISIPCSIRTLQYLYPAVSIPCSIHTLQYLYPAVSVPCSIVVFADQGGRQLWKGERVSNWRLFHNFKPSFLELSGSATTFQLTAIKRLDISQRMSQPVNLIIHNVKIYFQPNGLYWVWQTACWGNQPGKVKLCATAFMMGTLLVVEKFNCQAHSYFAAGQLVDDAG